MRHINSYSKAIAVFIALLLSLASAHSRKKFNVAYYKQTGQQSCTAGILPSNCDQVVTGTICTSSVGGVTRTWYVDSQCSVPCYRQF